VIVIAVAVSVAVLFLAILFLLLLIFCFLKRKKRVVIKGDLFVPDEDVPGIELKQSELREIPFTLPPTTFQARENFTYMEETQSAVTLSHTPQ
jgi:hypothetical protein